MKLSSYINTALCAAASCLPLANSHAAEHSVGAGINSLGLDLQYTQKQNWSLREGDQIQLRFAVSGLKLDDIDDADIDGTDYDIDLDLFSLRGGLDWYPFAGKRSDNFFFSGGLGYISSEFEARSEKNQNFSVGNTRINANDDFSLTIEGEQKSIAPYLSVGWGNRLREKGGLAFRTELLTRQ